MVVIIAHKSGKRVKYIYSNVLVVKIASYNPNSRFSISSNFLPQDVSNMHRRYTMMTTMFAQFVDHDVTLTPISRGFQVYILSLTNYINHKFHFFSLQYHRTPFWIVVIVIHRPMSIRNAGQSRFRVTILSSLKLTFRLAGPSVCLLHALYPVSNAWEPVNRLIRIPLFWISLTFTAKRLAKVRDSALSPAVDSTSLSHPSGDGISFRRLTDRQNVKLLPDYVSMLVIPESLKIQAFPSFIPS